MNLKVVIHKYKIPILVSSVSFFILFYWNDFSLVLTNIPDTINSQGDCNADFLDSMGYTCKEYIDNEYCTPNGGYGENWKDSWGPIRDYAMNGNDAFDCPECGCGGDSPIDEVPRCHSSECWCISAGGNTCGNAQACYPDECWSREECPGNGYWCIDGLRSNDPIEKNEFCIQDRMAPSIFVIGIQKCGTTTIDGTLSQWSQLSHGRTKEHHFFDHVDLVDNSHKSYEDYLKEFPKCNNKIVQTFDSTPNYSNPLSNAPENIARFYNHFRLNSKKLTFIAIICPNSRRIPSAFYHEKFVKTKKHAKFLSVKNSTMRLNDWFNKTPNQQIDDSYAILGRGYYDLIFDKYLKLFPDSTFLLIDSDYAFIGMQELGNFLAKELNLSQQKIEYLHMNSHEGKGNNELREELTLHNLKRLKELYLIHDVQFKELINTNGNVKTFPADNYNNNNGR